MFYKFRDMLPQAEDDGGRCLHESGRFLRKGFQG